MLHPAMIESLPAAFQIPSAFAGLCKPFSAIGHYDAVIPSR